METEITDMQGMKVKLPPVMNAAPGNVLSESGRIGILLTILEFLSCRRELFLGGDISILKT